MQHSNPRLSNALADHSYRTKQKAVPHRLTPRSRCLLWLVSGKFCHSLEQRSSWPKLQPPAYKCQIATTFIQASFPPYLSFRNNNQQPMTNKHQPQPTTDSQLPTTTNNRHPTTNHQPPTTTNNHPQQQQQPTTNHQQPTTNHRPPTTTNHQQHEQTTTTNDTNNQRH